MAEIKPLASFRRGESIMAFDAIDFYEKDGKIWRHHWAMGGQSLEQVDAVPDVIDHYHRQLEATVESTLLTASIAAGYFSTTD